MRALGSVYMRWAKEHAAARYNLANSGLLPCTLADLAPEPEDLELNGANADGHPPLLAAIAARYGVEPDEVALAPGASGANFLALAALLAPGDQVLVERPAYEPILAALSFLGARIQRFERRFEDGYRPDLAELAKILVPPVRLLVLTNPHNPSGVLLPPQDLAEIAHLAAAAGARVLVDEVYRDALFDQAPPSHVHLGPHVLATSSLTKSYGLSGLRCGWVLATADLVQRMRRLNDLMSAAGPLPAETLALAAFRRLDRLAERARALLDPNQALIHDFLAAHPDHLDCIQPSRSMVVFPRLRAATDAGPLHDRLRHRETSIVPGVFFESPRHFRLGFGIRTEDLRQGLAHLSQELRA